MISQMVALTFFKKKKKIEYIWIDLFVIINIFD